jgi:hypothetical protein
MTVRIGRLWILILIVLMSVGLAGCATLAAEGIARTLNDPGPTVTVPMIPLGPPSAPLGLVEQQTQADSSRCAGDARVSAGHQIRSQAARAKLATELYVLCMAGQGYRCAVRSEHKACEAAWTHPTAARGQWLQDSGECRRAVFWTWGLASTVRARYLECMTSKGYRADVGEPTGRDLPPPSTPSDQQQELIRAAKTHYCRHLHPGDNAVYDACLAE